MDLLDRVNARTLIEQASRLVDTPCYLWQGSTTRGYGTIQLGRLSPGGHRSPCYVHVAMYQYFLGAVPEGKELDHICRVRHCWRLDHLQAITHARNVRLGDSIAADYAVRDECQRGHPKTPENRYYRPDGKGWTCRACQRLRSSKDYREANAARRKAEEANAPVAF